MKINFLILTLAVFFSSCLSADFDPNQYRRYVTETYYLKSTNSTHLRLTDDTQYYLEKSYDVDIPIGTEIFISTFSGKTHKEKYYFEFASKESPHQRKYGWLTCSSEDSLPAVKEIHKIRVKTKKLKIMELSDGSKWVIKGSDSKWEIGSHILISFDFNTDYSELTLINTDKSETFVLKYPDETGRISKWQHSENYSEHAKPYLE